MIYKDESVFSKEYKESNGNYLLYGSEPYLVDMWCGKIAGNESSGIFNFHKFEGENLDTGLVNDAVNAMSFTPGKVVVINRLNTSRISAEDVKDLCWIAENIPEDCRFIITGKEEFDKKSAGAKALIKAFDKAGTVLELGERSKAHQVAFIKKSAKEYGCRISDANASLVLDICENDMNTLNLEIKKLFAYKMNGEVTREDILSIVTKSVEAKVFDLSKFILAGNMEQAFRTLGDLFYLKEPPISILSILIMAYNDLYRAKLAKQAGIPPQTVAEMFSYKGREFVIRNAFGASISLAGAKKCIGVLYGCDKKLKSSPVDSEILLEKAVVDLYMCGRVR